MPRSYFQKRLLSFKWAFKGVFDLCKNHPNAQIHLFAAMGVIFMGWYFNILVVEWCIIIICISMVLSLEAMNSAIEYIVDLVAPEQHELAGKAKDIAASAVLIGAVGAAIIGMLIFIPYVLALF